MIFVLGTFALGVIIPAKDINLTQSLLVGFDNYFRYIHASWLSPIIAVALAFGVLAGVLTWVAGPSKGIFAVGKAGYMPPFFQKTNKLGVQKNILVRTRYRCNCIKSVVRRYAVRTELLSDSVTADSYSLSDYVLVDVLRSYRIAL